MTDRCFVYTSAEDLEAAVADGRVSKHDAQIIRQFGAFLAQAPPSPKLHPEKENDDGSC
jgi:hypothetical protein